MKAFYTIFRECLLRILVEVHASRLAKEAQLQSINELVHLISGFHGSRCESEYNECLSCPCQHGGTCVDKLDKFDCRCPPGYTGTLCEHQVTWHM